MDLRIQRRSCFIERACPGNRPATNRCVEIDRQLFRVDVRCVDVEQLDTILIIQRKIA